MARKTPADVERRFAELVALGLSAAEAARAVGFSERHGARLLQRPEIRAQVEAAKKGADAPSLRAVVEGLLEDRSSTVRARGAELALRYQEQLKDVDPFDGAALPEGVYLVYPGFGPDDPDGEPLVPAHQFGLPGSPERFEAMRAEDIRLPDGSTGRPRPEPTPKVRAAIEATPPESIADLQAALDAAIAAQPDPDGG